MFPNLGLGTNPPAENTGIPGVPVKKIQVDDSGDPK